MILHQILAILFALDPSSLPEGRIGAVNVGDEGRRIEYDLRRLPANQYQAELVQDAQNAVHVASSLPDTVAAINGPYLRLEGGIQGLLVADGKVLQPADPALSACIGVGADARLVLVRTADATPEAWRWAHQAGPFLIDPGGVDGIHSDDGKLAWRSLIGLTNDGTILLMRVGPCSLKEAMDLAKTVAVDPSDPNPGHIEVLANLDGGPASVLWTGGSLAKPGIPVLAAWRFSPCPVGDAAP